MKGDFTRNTFNARNGFSQVLMQQGRVTLDADFNEQGSILLYQLRALARDLIGPYGGPRLSPGFTLRSDSDGLLWINPGRYYVDGVLVENRAGCLYTAQPNNRLPEDDPFTQAMKDKDEAQFWLYLDVWEQHITSLEDDAIREKALGGPDTCTRAKVMWQVKALEMSINTEAEGRAKKKAFLVARKDELTAQLAKAKNSIEKTRIQNELKRIESKINFYDRPAAKNQTCPTPLDLLLPLSDARMGARVDPGAQFDDACITSPDSKYRGAENQLYRVEIHRGGVAGEATFKWSRENGSVSTAWLLGSTGYDLQVANARGFAAGNWVELTDDVAETTGVAPMLVKLAKVEGGKLSVDQAEVTEDEVAWSSQSVNPKVRRWDHFETEDIQLEEDGSILIVETPTGSTDDVATWLDLEDGLQVQFAAGGIYRTGDYWLIPARVGSGNGNIEWPPAESSDNKTATALVSPRGVVHHYAPLGFVDWDNQKIRIKSCYCEFEPMSSCFAKPAPAQGTDVASPHVEPTPANPVVVETHPIGGVVVPGHAPIKKRLPKLGTKKK